MPVDTTSELRIVERAGPAQRVVMRAVAPGGDDLWVFGGYRGPALPAVLPGARIESQGGGSYRIKGRQESFEFAARVTDRIALRPSLFHALHSPFALGARDRLAARLLLVLLRLPGGAKLLRLWHARRAR